MRNYSIDETPTATKQRNCFADPNASRHENSDGIDTIGLFNPGNGYFYLRNANTAGNADLVFAFW